MIHLRIYSIFKRQLYITSSIWGYNYELQKYQVIRRVTVHSYPYFLILHLPESGFYFLILYVNADKFLNLFFALYTIP